ncbi:MAG: hypothetical protein RLZZ200_2254 [Pseudomonadota bacterium]|jgi:hypothetical protein
MDGFKVGGKKILGVTLLIASSLVSFIAPQTAEAGRRRTTTTTVAPLTISGTPATTDVAGTQYSFTPSTSGGGSTKSFAISNKPAWASFSISTGAMSGTPTTSQVGTYANVTISVTDGRTTATLAPFSIAVTAPPPVLGSATLTWSAPSQNTDGSTLVDLTGYNVYYGTSPTSLTNKIVVANAGTTTYTVGSLPSGTYYFAVSAYNVNGIESTPSNVGSKTIP